MGMGLFPSLISATERGTLADLTASATELNYSDITTLGTAQASKVLTVSASKKLLWTTTSSATSNPMQMTNTMTGAGTTGGRMLVEMVTAVTLGGWAQAIKALTTFGSAGAVTGLASSLNAEMQVGAQCSVTGTYAPLEQELVIDTGGATANTKTAFSYMNVTGDDLGVFNTNGFWFMMGTGVSPTSVGMFRAAAVTAVNSTHALRVHIGGVTYYMPLHTSVGFA